MQQNKKTISDYIRQVGAYGILLTCFALGTAIAGAIWSATVSNLNYQIGQIRLELNSKTDELNQVKTDYLSYKAINESGIKQSNPIVIPIDTLQKVKSDVEVSRINTEKSHAFFSGELIISLIAIPFEGDPLRHQVVANISSNDGQVVKIDKEDVGMVVTYNGKRKYVITILEVETFSATFQVRKN